MKRFEHRNIVQTAHADGTIRLWDAGHGDEIENDTVVQVDVDRAVGKPGGVEISKMSLAGASGELSVGTRSGEVVIFRWDHNRTAGREPPDPVDGRPGELFNISTRADPGLSDGLIPYTMVDMQSGPVTALKNSDVGFVAAAFQNGGVIVIDMRGPVIIFKANLRDFNQPEKRGFGRHSHRAQSQEDYATFLEFSVRITCSFFASAMLTLFRS
jgi:hypothetical protein